MITNADVIQDLKNNKCELTVDGREINSQLGDMGRAFYSDDKSGVSVMVSTFINDAISIHVSKAATSVGFNTGFISINKNSSNRISVKIFKANLCSNVSKEVGCIIEFQCSPVK
jgi:hypothetical protein